MFRQYDFQCLSCGYEHADLIEVPHGVNAPLDTTLDCKHCDAQTLHARLVSLPARYMGEAVCNPRMFGGECDTMGFQQPPPCPDVPELSSSKDYKEYYSTPEWKEYKRQNKEIETRNKKKRARARAIKSGANVNMKRDRLPGDPKI